MSNFHNYAHWRAKNSNKKTRLGQFPAVAANTPLGAPYRIDIRGSYHEPEKAILTGHRASGSPSQLEDNTPDINLTLPQNLVSPAFKMLHHLVKAHDNIIPHPVNSSLGPSPASILNISDTENALLDQAHPRPEDNPRQQSEFIGNMHKTSPDKDNIPALSIYNGDIRSSEDLTHALSHLFSSLVLGSLNRSIDNPIQHPGRDYVIDHALDNKVQASHNPDAFHSSLNKQHAQHHEDNLRVYEVYRRMLHDYLQHHANDPEYNGDFHDYLTASGHPQIMTDYFKELLKGPPKK